MNEALPWSPAPTDSSTPPVHGRYLGPLAAVPRGVPRWRLKHWHFTSVVGERDFLALGLVQLGYVAQAFAYLVALQDGRRQSYEALSPLGCALRMAESPVRGTSHWRRRGAQLLARAGDGGWDYDIDLPLGDRRLQGALHVPWGDGLSLLYPLNGGRGGRTAYTYKVADVPVRAELTLGSRALPLEGSRGASDWTHSHADRDTRWRWASACGRARDGRALGLNLSTDVYDLDGVSQENVLWLDGRPQPLGRIELHPPRDPGHQPWQLRGEQTQMRFIPRGARTDRRELGVVASHFVQAVGTFEGRVAGHDVETLHGLMEDHRARW